ncbi:hypothetical protein DCS_01046 [Drechmeria coniospora]|uniref:Uncharacterized protein n=1 Tax=Drechmeria coniospora TaxID=98403 RepID=A0A151GSC3_DRECN|nr:hypothetical protein DCS_01046 [Drechmeria coniospora]KYK59912.1 hypothetical protein DCS_01046 [Drechmeria coniospora]
MRGRVPPGMMVETECNAATSDKHVRVCVLESRVPGRGSSRARMPVRGVRRRASRSLSSRSSSSSRPFHPTGRYGRAATTQAYGGCAWTDGTQAWYVGPHRARFCSTWTGPNARHSAAAGGIGRLAGSLDGTATDGIGSRESARQGVSVLAFARIQPWTAAAMAECSGPKGPLLPPLAARIPAIRSFTLSSSSARARESVRRRLMAPFSFLGTDILCHGGYRAADARRGSHARRRPRYGRAKGVKHGEWSRRYGRNGLLMVTSVQRRTQVQMRRRA